MAGLLRGASSEGSVRAWDSFASRSNPARLMLRAALWSRSREQPHEQLCQRSERSFFWNSNIFLSHRGEAQEKSVLDMITESGAENAQLHSCRETLLSPCA